jgi:O-antigen ligase
VADQQSKQLRFYIWNEAFRIIKSSPLTGVGADGVKINFKNVPGYEERVWTETHNIYLQQAAERGVIGLGILLWVFVILLKQLWRAPNVWRPALVSLLAAFLVAGLTESWINDSEVAMIFWTFCGCVSILKARVEHDASI